MKRTIIILTISSLLFACNSKTDQAVSTQQQVAQQTYVCPMDCEDGKTYAEVGKCPVCHMDLTEKE